MMQREQRTQSGLLRELIREAAEKRGLLPVGLISLQEVLDKGGEDGNQ